MIDYKDLDKFYVGVAMPVISNCGGLFMELGEDISSLFYKLNEDYYADVNHKGRIVQVLRKDAVITSKFVLDKESLAQVNSKRELNKNSHFVKRLMFKPTNYSKNITK